MLVGSMSLLKLTGAEGAMGSISRWKKTHQVN